jgi:hypothetical protein
MYTKCLWRNLKERSHLEDLRLDRKVILRSIFRNLDVGHELNRAGSGYGQVEGSCESGNETSVSIKCREFLGWLKTG